MTSEATLTCRDRLYRFFSFHEPSQLPVINQWLLNWSGRETEMFNSLILHHGAEPPLSYSTTADRPSVALSRQQALLRDVRSLLQQHLLFYSPQDIHTVDDIMSKWATKEDQLFRLMEKIASRRDAVFRFFAQHAPNQMSYAVVLAREWYGHEAALVSYLERNNGRAPTRALSYPPLQLPEYQRVALARERLYRVLEHYQPDRLVDADAMLEAFRGREEELFGMLRSKYLSSAPPAGSTATSPHPRGGKTSVVGGISSLVTSEFGLCVQMLAESWLRDESDIQRVEEALGGLLGTEVTPGEVLLRLAAITPAHSQER